MNSNLGNYGLKYYRGKIEILVLGVTPMPSCLNTSRYAKKCLDVKDCTNDSYKTSSLTVIGKQSGKLGQNGLGS